MTRDAVPRIAMSSPRLRQGGEVPGRPRTPRESGWRPWGELSAEDLALRVSFLDALVIKNRLNLLAGEVS